MKFDIVISIFYHRKVCNFIPLSKLGKEKCSKHLCLYTVCSIEYSVYSIEAKHLTKVITMFETATITFVL